MVKYVANRLQMMDRSRPTFNIILFPKLLAHRCRVSGDVGIIELMAGNANYKFLNIEWVAWPVDWPVGLFWTMILLLSVPISLVTVSKPCLHIKSIKKSGF